AAVHAQTGALRERDLRPHADPQDDEGGVGPRAALEPGRASLDADDRLAEMEDYAVLLVDPANEAAHLGTHHLFERLRLGRDHVHRQPARAQRRGDLEPDEARTDD